MHHICQFSLCRLQVESWAIGREVQVWFRVLKKKVSFSASTPLRSSSKSKIRSHKEMKFFSSFCCIILLQQGCNNPVPGLLQPCTMVVTTLHHGCYRVNYKAKYKVVTTMLQPCMFHGCYNLELQPCYNLVAPL